MVQECNAYPQEIISLFVDNELDPDQAKEVSNHVRICLICADQAAKFQKLGQVFEAHATQALAKTIPVLVTDRAHGKPHGKHLSLPARLFNSMNLYVKLASLVAVAFLLILAVFQNPSQIGPSAIVKSLDTTASSVMIIETPTEKHTIIWFSET